MVVLEPLLGQLVPLNGDLVRGERDGGHIHTVLGGLALHLQDGSHATPHPDVSLHVDNLVVNGLAQLRLLCPTHYIKGTSTPWSTYSCVQLQILLPISLGPGNGDIRLVPNRVNFDQLHPLQFQSQLVH